MCSDVVECTSNCCHHLVSLRQNVRPFLWFYLSIGLDYHSDSSWHTMDTGYLAATGQTVRDLGAGWSCRVHNSKHTIHTHATRVQNTTVTALHTLNNTVAKGFNQMAPPTRTITVALGMSKAFDIINRHTLIRKLLQTNIPDTIIKFIANYIKRRKAYTTYRNHTSKQRRFKTGVPQGGVLSPTLFTIYTSDLPPPSAQVQVMAYADDIAITSTSSAKKYIQPYLQKVFAWTNQKRVGRHNNVQR